MSNAWRIILLEPQGFYIINGFLVSNGQIVSFNNLPLSMEYSE